MLEFLAKFPFLKRFFTPRERTRAAARDRLRAALVHDRSKVNPGMMEALRQDLLGVVSRYMEVEPRAMELGLRRGEGAVALSARIPVVCIRRTAGTQPPLAPPALPVPEPPARPQEPPRAASRRRRRRRSRSRRRSRELRQKG